MTNVILPPDTVLQSRYLIERLIAQGGMGAVYQAVDQRLGNTVALKQILVTDPSMRKAFEREARLLAGLRHTALPVVSDHFTEDAGQFLVMQYIAGDDLGTMLDRKANTFTTPTGMAQVLAWANQVLDALAYLHNHDPSIIHRDIKPQNLKLSERGDIVLLDFGLAKGAVGQSLSSTTARSVRAYTAQYAPLEQIQGTGTEPRSDLYALAATLYHLLTGEAPPNALTRASAVLAGNPDPLAPIHKLNPNVPPQVSAILHQAMAHGIAKRFASADAMRAALHVVQQTMPALVGPDVNSSGQQTIAMPAASGGQADMSAARLPDAAPLEQMQKATTDVFASATLVVSAQGHGRYKTIAAAIAEAGPGSRIVVRPGLYKEELLLDKQLEISGEGPCEEIIIEGTHGPALTMQTEAATVRGLTLRVYTSGQKATRPAVDIPQGRLALEHCRVTSDGRLCIMIHGVNANPIIWRCQIYESKGIGVLVHGRGRGTVEECDIYGNAQAGVAMRTGGNPTIRRCTISQGANDGIYVDEKGLGTVEECTIHSNARAGIEIKRGSTPFIRRCIIREQTQGYGIYICDRGEGFVEECDISANARAGVAITQASNPLVRRCKIHHERQRGVLFSDYAQGTLDQCEIVDNGQIGVEIRQGSDPTVRQCKINRHAMVAIWAHEKGGGTIERCDLTDNKRGAWHIEGGSELSRRGNKE